MAHFYGNLKGSRGEATRCGTRQSGIGASVRSWAGSVTVRLVEVDGKTLAVIQACEGSGVGGSILYSGPLADLVRAVKFCPQEPTR